MSASEQEGTRLYDPVQGCRECGPLYDIGAETATSCGRLSKYSSVFMC